MSNSIGHLTGLNVTKAQLREEYVARNWQHLHKVTDVVRANCEQHREEYREYIREEEAPEQGGAVAPELVALGRDRVSEHGALPSAGGRLSRGRRRPSGPR